MTSEFYDDDYELITADADENAEEADLLIEQAQPTVVGYFVAFHKTSGNIVSIDRNPNKLPNDEFLELYLDHHPDLDAVFSNKLNVDKLKVRYDISKKSYVLIVSQDFGRLFAHEFILVDISTVDNYIIDIKFNLVNKNVYFRLNHKKLAFYLSTQTPEYVLELSNSGIVYYLFDKLDPTLLYDRYTIRLKDLIRDECIKFKADWLDLMRTHEFRLLTSNVGIESNIVIDDQYVKDHLDYETVDTEVYPETPSLKLIVADGVMTVQSLLIDPENYKLDENFNLYIHKENEPESLLRTYTINRNELANHNKFVLDKQISGHRISAVCDPRYLNVEIVYE